MRILKIIAAVGLLTIAGLAIGESIEVINLSNGDYVNKDNFTIVSKGEAFAEGDRLNIRVEVTNHTTGNTVRDFVKVATK